MSLYTRRYQITCDTLTAGQQRDYGPNVETLEITICVETHMNSKVLTNDMSNEKLIHIAKSLFAPTTIMQSERNTSTMSGAFKPYIEEPIKVKDNVVTMKKITPYND